MRYLIIADSWVPQINGVANTYANMVFDAPKLGFELVTLTPRSFATVPCPTYQEIRLALATTSNVERKIEAARADYIHIATEGPLGILARAVCNRHRRPFTTCYHTRFPEYVAARFPIPKQFISYLQRGFHNTANATLVRSPLLLSELKDSGYRHLQQWMGGVDLELFYPRRNVLGSLKRPIFLYVGRLAIEKNIEEFLRLDLPGTKLVVGHGPQESYLRRTYPQVIFVGPQVGIPLAQFYSSADVFVFPSRTDTYGMVVLEALAAGLPVAAHSGPGPSDLITSGVNGLISEDLEFACLSSLDLDRTKIRASAERFGKIDCTTMFARIVKQAAEMPRACCVAEVPDLNDVDSAISPARAPRS